MELQNVHQRTMTKLYVAKAIAQLKVEVKCRISSAMAGISWGAEASGIFGLQ